VDVPTEVLESARLWLARVAHPTQPGRYAYQPGRNYTAAMTAESMFVRGLLGEPRDDDSAKASARFLVANMPNWNRRPNTYYWYYATLALYQNQGEAWTRWNEVVTKQLLTHQRKTGKPAGSWDPVGEWAPTGGRVYQTALCTLMLEVYYRYLPMYSSPGAKSMAEGPGTGRPAQSTVTGIVKDAVSHEPIRAATIRLDMPGRPLV